MLASTPDMQYFPGLTKVFILSGLSFLIAIAWTPLLLKFLKNTVWAKASGRAARQFTRKCTKKKKAPRLWAEF